jgi:hypothetical protein
MKKLVTEVENEGLEKLLGETVTLFCLNFFYNGKLVGVNDTCVLLESPKVIYETGAWTDGYWKDCQSMNIDELYVQKQAIESFAVTK